MCGSHAALLDRPDEFRTGVIEGEIDVGGLDDGRDTLGRRVLELRDEVFVFRGGEAFALRLVQEDVVAEQLDAGGGHGVHRRTGSGCRIGAECRRPPELLEGGQLENQADGMRLKGNQRQGFSDRVTKPEAEGDNEALGLARGRGGKHVGVSDHVIEGDALVGGHREGGPDLEPGTGVFVNLLVADFD